MDLQDLKDRLKDAVETDNPPGTDYYGAEVDEEDVEAARERMEKASETEAKDREGSGYSHISE